QAVKSLNNQSVQNLFKLSLMSSAMSNCNAKKDGKCLRYRPAWEQRNFDKETFLMSFEENIQRVEEDIEAQIIDKKPNIINGDCRRVLDDSKEFDKFKL